MGPHDKEIYSKQLQSVIGTQAANCWPQRGEIEPGLA